MLGLFQQVRKRHDMASHTIRTKNKFQVVLAVFIILGYEEAYQFIIQVLFAGC